ncbi:MAG: TIGR03620 family F420-dependent LLM class oxidoreductase [Alphaproteobacteria bacterium]|nr:MAG: TIGR03620 family F420-dependent LLM class oxidoreductase [Alphaproteobacteria bacterium]
MELGKRAVWAPTEGLGAPDVASFAQQIEAWGYSALWIPEALGRDPMVAASWMLANTENLIVATGIANIYGRDARAMKAAQVTLSEQSGGRFLLGLGVSHKPLVEAMRGHEYLAPIPTMRNYLDAMAKCEVMTQPPPEEPPTVIAALGPKMLELAKTMTQGAHPYLVPPEYTVQAREILGEDTWLCVEQKVLLETDATKARAIARQTLAIYLPLPNYRNNLVRCGFKDDDFENNGSDRLVDAIVAWGDADTIAVRIKEHEDAGATQVCIQALNPDGGAIPDNRILELLAPANT